MGLLPINLISLRQTYEACQSQAPELFQLYLHNFGIKLMKHQEREDLMCFIDRVREHISPSYMSGFYIGYTIPQISKEFDLLRIGSNYILNIEIKHQGTFEKIQKQLRQNRHYLLALNPAVRIFSYIVTTGEIYCLDERSADVSPATLAQLIRYIKEQEIVKVADLDRLFSPKQYLVSPLSSPEKFIHRYYFLTNHQEEIKKSVLKAFAGGEIKCALISGTAGTGKTLLVYDISHHYKLQNRQEVYLIHCGKLSEGHLYLKSRDWNIYEIGDYRAVLEKADRSGGLVVFDEAQRIHRRQMIDIFKRMPSIRAGFIFSYDPKQYISNAENRGALFKKLQVPYISHTLKTTIRTNKEIASFINKLLDLRRLKHDPHIQYKNIHLQYFEDVESLRQFLDHLKSTEGWEVLNYPDPHSGHALTFHEYQDRTNKSVHEIIGLEFDKVAVVINEYFYYQNGRLYSKGHPTEYQMNQMLFQQMTRTREELFIIIYKNLEILKCCLEILRK
jgi:hypothetical protein